MQKEFSLAGVQRHYFLLQANIMNNLELKGNKRIIVLKKNCSPVQNRCKPQRSTAVFQNPIIHCNSRKLVF